MINVKSPSVGLRLGSDCWDGTVLARRICDVELTQGGAELAGARSGLPWAMVFNALGVLSWCTDFSRRPALVLDTDFSRNLRRLKIPRLAPNSLELVLAYRGLR